MRRRRVRVALRPLVGERAAVDHVVHRLGDVGGVVADALDVLGAEQQMRAERDVARILHHVGEQLAEQRGVDRVDLLVAAATPSSALATSRARIGVEHVLELARAPARPCARRRGSRCCGGEVALPSAMHALGDVLGEVADALEVVRRCAIAPTISRRSTAIGWRRAMMQDRAAPRSRAAARRSSGRRRSRCCGELGVALGAARRPTSAICFSARPPISAIMRARSLQVVVEGAWRCVRPWSSSSRPAPVSRSGR